MNYANGTKVFCWTGGSLTGHRKFFGTVKICAKNTWVIFDQPYNNQKKAKISDMWISLTEWDNQQEELRKQRELEQQQEEIKKQELARKTAEQNEKLAQKGYVYKELIEAKVGDEVISVCTYTGEKLFVSRVTKVCGDYVLGIYEEDEESKKERCLGRFGWVKTPSRSSANKTTKKRQPKPATKKQPKITISKKHEQATVDFGNDYYNIMIPITDKKVLERLINESKGFTPIPKEEKVTSTESLPSMESVNFWQKAIIYKLRTLAFNFWDYNYTVDEYLTLENLLLSGKYGVFELAEYMFISDAVKHNIEEVFYYKRQLAKAMERDHKIALLA